MGNMGTIFIIISWMVIDLLIMMLSVKNKWVLWVGYSLKYQKLSQICWMSWQCDVNCKDEKELCELYLLKYLERSQICSMCFIFFIISQMVTDWDNTLSSVKTWYYGLLYSLKYYKWEGIGSMFSQVCSENRYNIHYYIVIGHRLVKCGVICKAGMDTIGNISIIIS